MSGAGWTGCRCGVAVGDYGSSRTCRAGRLRGCAVSTAAGFAVVDVVAGSANGRSRVTMRFWLDPELISIDAGDLEHFARKARPR